MLYFYIELNCKVGDFLKKSLLSISALVIAFSVTLTACGKKQLEYIDGDGNRRVAVTEKGGSIVQNEYGDLYIVETDNNGETKTRAASFPEVMTNKSNSVIENGAVKVNVPKGWETSGLTSVMKICHNSGKCVKKGSPNCEISFSYELNKPIDDLYQKYLGEIQTIINTKMGVDLKEYEKEVLGKTAKVIYYKIDNADVNCYCYLLMNGPFATRIEAYTSDCCYSEDELIALLNECCTLKDLGGKTPDFPTTAPTEIPTEAASQTATSAVTSAAAGK